MKIFFWKKYIFWFLRSFRIGWLTFSCSGRLRGAGNRTVLSRYPARPSIAATFHCDHSDFFCKKVQHLSVFRRHFGLFGGKFCIEHDDIAECMFCGFSRTQPIGLPGGICVLWLRAHSAYRANFTRDGYLRSVQNNRISDKMWGSKSGWVYDCENFVVYGLDFWWTSGTKSNPRSWNWVETSATRPAIEKPRFYPQKHRKKADFRRFSLKIEKIHHFTADFLKFHVW